MAPTHRGASRRRRRQCNAHSLVLTSPLPASPTSLRVKMPPSPSIPRVEPTARLLCVCLPVGSPARALDSRASPRSAGGGVIMARFARWRASRWIGVGGSGHRRLLICLLFFLIAKRQSHSRSAQVLLLHCRTSTSQTERPSSFSSMQNANLTAEAPKSPLHNSANAVMRMVVFLFQRAKR